MLICDFLLVINSNFGPICYCFRDKMVNGFRYYRALESVSIASD